MANFSPEWTRYGYDNASSWQPTYTRDGKTTFGILNVTSLVGMAGLSNAIVINRSNTLEDEVFYVSYLHNLAAIQTGGSKTGTNYTAGAVLWTFSGDAGTFTNYSNECLSLSNNGSKVYFAPRRTNSFLYAIDASDGSKLWEQNPSTGSSNEWVTTPLEDNDDFLYCAFVQNNSANFHMYKLNTSDGSIEDSRQIGTTFDTFYQFAAMNSTKNAIWMTYESASRCFVVRMPTSLSSQAVFNLTADGGSQHIEPTGIALDETSNEVLYVVGKQAGGGLYKVDASIGQLWVHNPIDPTSTRGNPCVSSDGATVYYRADTTLYAINADDGSQKWKTSIIPSNTKWWTGVTLDSNNNIIVTSDNANAVANVHVFSDQTTFPQLEDSFRVGIAANELEYASILDQNGKSYFQSGTNLIYVLYNPTPTTTTTTTTAIAGESSSSSSSEESSSSSSEEAVTTTTTTTLHPLLVVKTSLHEEINGVFEVRDSTDASDNTNTQNTPFSNSFNFGTLAPGETSQTIIISLQIPHTRAIGSIKLGLVDNGDIPLQSTTFGITSSAELRSDITPETYFQGVNSDNTSTNAYNISIDNLKNDTSNYVYLNITLPLSQPINSGIIKYKWFFDYSD